MLIINNGVPKSGSTWVQRILVQGLDPNFPDKKWRNFWKNPSIDPVDLPAYIKSGEWEEIPTLIKMHFAYNLEYKSLIRDGIKIIVSHRNIPDSVVSWFHHQVRMGKTTLDQRQAWLETRGREFARRAVNHRLSWSNKSGAYLIRYENMLYSAPAEIERLFSYIGHKKTPEECSELARKTEVKLDANAPLREGKHVRTAGRSVAKDELPEELYNEFCEMERDISLE